MGVTFDDSLNFTEHIRIICQKAARQLNALARLAKHLSYEDKRAAVNSFVRSNFQYCSLVWHFCGQTNNNKLEKIQGRALKILHNDYSSTYAELISKSNMSTLMLSRLRATAFEVYKTTNQINITCLSETLRIKETNYTMRNSHKLIQPHVNTTTYGLRSFSYLAPKLWNDMINENVHVVDMNVNEFQHFIRRWNGPNFETYSHFL